MTQADEHGIPSRCFRCGSFMFPCIEVYSDNGIGRAVFDRCYICGNYEDTVILRNRAAPPEWDRDFRDHNKKTFASARTDYLVVTGRRAIDTPKGLTKEG